MGCIYIMTTATSARTKITSLPQTAEVVSRILFARVTYEQLSSNSSPQTRILALDLTRQLSTALEANTFDSLAASWESEVTPPIRAEKPKAP